MRPVGFEIDQLLIAGSGRVGLAAGLLKQGGFQEWGEFPPISLLLRLLARPDLGQERRPLSFGIADGLVDGVHLLIAQDPDHFEEDRRSVGLPLDRLNVGDNPVDPTEPDHVRLFGLLAKVLARVERGFLIGGGERFGQGHFGGVFQMVANAIGGDLGDFLHLFAEILDPLIGRLHLIAELLQPLLGRTFQPPLHQRDAADQYQRRAAQAQNQLLKTPEATAEGVELILELQELQFEFDVVVGTMPQVAVPFEPLPPCFLQGPAFGLKGEWIGVVGVAGQVEFVDGRVVRAILLGKDDPGFLASASRVEELVLRVGDAAVFGVGLGRFRAEALADDLDEPFAVVDLIAENLLEITRLGAEDILPDGVVAETRQDVGR